MLKIKLDVIVLILSGLIGIASYILSSNYRIFEHLSDIPTLQQMASLGLSLLFLIIGERVGFAIRSAGINTQLNQSNEKLLSIVRSEIDTEVFDNPKAAHSYLVESFKNINKICNTVIRIAPKQLSITDFYDVKHTAKWHKALESVLLSGGTLHEIYSKNMGEYAVQKINFFSKINGFKDHRVWELDAENMPFTNFIIVYRDELPNEVLYGWSFDAKDINPHVFLSRNEKLIQYFESQFQALISASALSHPKK